MISEILLKEFQTVNVTPSIENPHCYSILFHSKLWANHQHSKFCNTTWCETRFASTAPQGTHPVSCTWSNQLIRPNAKEPPTKTTSQPMLSITALYLSPLPVSTLAPLTFFLYLMLPFTLSTHPTYGCLPSLITHIRSLPTALSNLLYIPLYMLKP